MQLHFSSVGYNKLTSPLKKENRNQFNQDLIQLRNEVSNLSRHSKLPPHFRRDPVNKSVFFTSYRTIKKSGVMVYSGFAFTISFKLASTTIIKASFVIVTES